MSKYLLAAAVVAAIAISGAAFAGEATHQGKAKGPVAMSDSQLDKVTAGSTLSVARCGDLGGCGVPFVSREIGAPEDITIHVGSGKVN